MPKTHELREPPTPDIQFDAQLADGLGFDYDDLDMNRRGHMTEKQIEKKSKTFTQTDGREAIVLLIILFSGLLIAAMMNHNGGIWSFISVGVVILVVAFVGINLNSSDTKKKELKKGELDYVMGTIELNPVHNGTIITMGDNVYKSNLGMMHPRNTKATQAFKHGEAYILYVLPKSHIIISAEPLTNSDNLDETTITE